MIAIKTEEALRRQNVFKELISTQGWKDLEAAVAHMVDSSMKTMDGKAAKDLSLGEVCEERGLRKGMMKVIQEARMRAEGR